MQDDLPDHSVITPFKKRKRHPLTDEEKLLNQEFARVRIIIENVLAQFKNFKALAERFRHHVNRWDDVFRYYQSSYPKTAGGHLNGLMSIQR